MRNRQGKLLYSPVLIVWEKSKILHIQYRKMRGGLEMAPLRQEDDYFFEEYEVMPNRPVKEIKTPPAPKKVNVKKAKGNVFLGVTAFMFALTIVCRYAMINNMNMENIRLKKELESINNTNAQLKLAAERQINLSEIEEYAKNNLGLQKPQNYQIEYINVDKKDLIDNKVVVENKTGIKEILLNIVEFFY